MSGEFPRLRRLSRKEVLELRDEIRDEIVKRTLEGDEEEAIEDLANLLAMVEEEIERS